MQRFEQLGIFGTASMMEFEGVVMFEVTVEEDAFQAIALREEWTLPPEVRLYFAPAQNPRSTDPAVAHLLRIFPRQSRWVPMVRLGLGSGRLVLRDGCFRIDGDETQPLVLFGRDTELARDGPAKVL